MLSHSSVNLLLQKEWKEELWNLWNRIAGVKSVFKLRSSASHTLLRCGACPHQTLSWSGAGASSVTASWGGDWGHTYPWSLTTPESMTPKHFPPVQSFPPELVSSTSDLANISSSGSLRRRQWHPTPVFLPGESQGGGGGWWAAVYGVAQSRIQLKRLSSSNQYEDWLLAYFAKT